MELVCLRRSRVAGSEQGKEDADASVQDTGGVRSVFDGGGTDSGVSI